MAALDPVPISSLTRKTTLGEVESLHPSLVDRSAYFSRHGWESLAREWIEFKERILPNDEVWEYRTEEVTLGMVFGERGVAIVRAGRAIERYPMSAWG